MAKIAIVNYGMGNLRSVQKGFEKVGASADITDDPNQLAEADKIVLPGVGAFRDAMARLREAGLDVPICEHVKSGKLFLGICLGMQLIFSKGYEDGEHTGLGILEGDVVAFAPQPGLKIPHMGWNTLRILKPAPHLADLPGEPSVYFVHGYYPQPTDASVVAAVTDYPTPFASAIWRDNVFAVQFHPEKSQKVGLKMLENFARL